MNINKAIKKQKKSYNRFLLLMCFIFFSMLAALLISREWKIFFISYLAAIEGLIIITILIRSNFERLTFKFENYKLKVKCGVFSSTLQINCEKLAISCLRKKILSLNHLGWPNFSCNAFKLRTTRD